MARVVLTTGTPPTGTGGMNVPGGVGHINAMTEELYARVGAPTTVDVTGSRLLTNADQNRALYCDTGGGGTITLTLPDNLEDDLWVLVINEGGGIVNFATPGTASVAPSVSLDNTSSEAVGLSNVTLHHKTAGAWRVYAGVPQAYDVQMGFLGSPVASATDRLLAGRPFLIDSADPGSVSVSANPAASWVLDVRVNGVSVGDVTVSTGGVVTWDIAADVELARGDVLSIVAPASADANIEDVLVAFRGLLS